MDEIENSATMWRGISQKVHGYDAIDTEDAVTVRSEVARLTRLYDRAVKTNTMNDPDHYGSGISVDNAQRGLKARTGQPFQMNQPQPPAVGAAAPAPIAISHPSADPDESPATQFPYSPPNKAVEVAKDVVSPPAAGTPSASPVAEAAKPEPVRPEAGPSQSKAPISSGPAPLVGTGFDMDESPATSANPTKAKGKSEDQPTASGASKSP